jgi:hypothetical protein
MQIEEQEQWIYGIRYDSLESAVSSFSESKNRPNSAMFVWCKSDIRQVITNAPEGCVVKLELEEQPVFTLRISQIEDGKKIEEIYAVCSPSKVDSLFTIASDCKYSIFKSLLSRIINHNYPTLSRVFLKDSEIRQLFRNMNEKHNIRIMVHRILSYSRSDNIQDKDLRWTRRPYDKIFEDLEDSNAWIKRIDFRASTERIERRVSGWFKLFEAGIGRDCLFKVKGDIRKFYQYVIYESIGIIGRRLGYLEKRSESAKNRRPEPIVIHFDRPIFGEKGYNEKFILKLEELKNISIINLHTNPYLHVSLLDHQDGSLYGIWIISENEINIIPQIRATIGSMTRLLNHIYQKVQEGETTKYRPLEVA